MEISNNNIRKDAIAGIYKAISDVIDDYLKGDSAGTRVAKSILHKKDYEEYMNSKPKDLKTAKREFLKPLNFTNLLIDIRYINFHLFGSKLEYKNIVKQILEEILEDKLSLAKDKKTEVIMESNSEKNIIEKLKNLTRYDWDIMHGEADEAYIETFARKGGDWIRSEDIDVIINEEDKLSNFTDLDYDQDSTLLGNCKKCGAKGVIPGFHRCVVKENIKSFEEVINENSVEDIKSFETFYTNIEKNVPIYEIKLPILKIEEILNNVNLVTNDTLKRVLVSFFKTYAEYIDISDKRKHLFKVNDMTGDIMNNNRIVFNAVIFDENDITTIKNNVVDFAMSELYTTLPEIIDVFGIQIKAISFINKDELKETFNMSINNEMVINIITNILNFKYEGKYQSFYIWSDKK